MRSKPWSNRVSMHRYAPVFVPCIISLISHQEIIKKQIEQHANYSLKTEYSKDKYKKRKEAKYVTLAMWGFFWMIACRYSKAFTTIEPTVYNVCDYWFNKDQSRIRDIRPDALAQILTLANIQPGGKYLAVDDASGLVVAGILERMGGRKWS